MVSSALLPVMIARRNPTFELLCAGTLLTSIDATSAGLSP